MEGFFRNGNISINWYVKRNWKCRKRVNMIGEILKPIFKSATCILATCLWCQCFFFSLLTHIESDVYSIYSLILTKLPFLSACEPQNLSRHDTSSELATRKGSAGESPLRHRRPSLGSRSDKETEYNCGTTNADTLSMDNNVVQSTNITVARYRGRMVAIKSLRKKKLKTDGVKFLKEMKQVRSCSLKGFVSVA